MGSELASRLTILVTLAVLGYNVFQLTNGYEWMIAQIGNFRSYVKEEGIDASVLRRLNLVLVGIVLTTYISLLFAAGFAWWVMGVFVSKYLLSAYLSNWLQERVLGGAEFAPRHLLVVKVDALVNVLLLGVLLLLCVAS